MQRLSKTMLVSAIVIAMLLCISCGNKADDSAGSGELGNISVGGSAPDTGNTTPENGNTSGSNAESPADTELKWPKASLPAGFPEYTDGSIDDITDFGDGDVTIIIVGTKESYYNEYVKKILAAGFVFDSEEELWDVYLRDEWELTLSFFVESDGDSYVWVSIREIYQSSYNFSNDWPKDLPFKLPEYTDGTIRSAMLSDDSLMIRIENTSKAAGEKYRAEVVKAGWTVKNDTNAPKSIMYTLDDYILVIDVDGTDVVISVIW